MPECILHTITEDASRAQILMEELKSERFSTNLFPVKSGRYKGYKLFVVTGNSLHTVDTELKINATAAKYMGIASDGHVIVTLARKSGTNQFLYDFASICPRMAQDLFMSDAWADVLDTWRTGSRFKTHLRPSVRTEKEIIRVAHIIESSREWWEYMLACEAEHAELVGHRTLKWGTSVQCASCLSMTRRLRVCKVCRLVSYCSQKCKSNDAGHAKVCKPQNNK